MSVYKFYYLSQGMRAVTALENGELDITATGSSPLSLAAARGVDIQMISVIDKDRLSQGLVTQSEGAKYTHRNESLQTITSPKDMIGRSIVSPYGSTAHFNLLWALQNFNLPHVAHPQAVHPNICREVAEAHEQCSKTKVNLFHGSPEKIIEWWDSGLIDGAASWEPTFSYTLHRAVHPGTNLIETDMLSDWGKFTFNALATTPLFASQHSAFIERMIAVMDLLAKDFSNWVQNAGPKQQDSLVVGSHGWADRSLWILSLIHI